MSGGWNPTVAPDLAISAARPAWRETIAAFVPGDAPPGMARRRRGGRRASRLAHASTTARAAGAAAAAIAASPRPRRRCPTPSDEAVALTPLWHVAASRGKAFVDFQNDVTADDIALAAREGFRSVEHLKRYTTLGMATDQGKTSQRQRPRASWPS